MKPDKENSELALQWDQAAEALETDPMRPVRYRKCFRYLSNLSRNTKIVEIGCGQGSGLSILQELGFQQLVGFEVSAERLQRARSKLRKGALLVLGDPVGTLPLKTRSVDTVVSAATIEHTVNPRAFVREIARIVRPGGRVIISSDCYTWRILLFLRLFRSLQPIDRALFPTTLFRYFRENRLQLIHYEGFPWPGHEFRFLRLFIDGILKAFKKLVWRVLPSLADWWTRHRVYQTSAETSLSPTAASEDGLLTEHWSEKRGLIPFLKLLFSDENVFFLIKRA